MSVMPPAEIAQEKENQLIQSARRGDWDAFSILIEPWHRPLFGYVYRMVAHPQDAEDLTQEAIKRALESLTRFRGDSRFKSWLFGITTHVCLDHLRKKKRWRVEAQVEGEKRATAEPDAVEGLGQLMSLPDFAFEVREHIAFCFSCVARTLAPEQQAALMLREVLGFSTHEAADILGLTESVFRHRLSSARSEMCDAFEGLCQLINKNGVCHQCSNLRELAPEGNRGKALARIEITPGIEVTPGNLFDARLKIVQEADLENGSTSRLHRRFFEGLSQHEEGPS